MTKSNKAKTEQTKQATGENEIIVTPFNRGRITVALLGITPFVCNRQSEKAKRELVFPSIKKKNEQRTELKHNPIEEYRDSPYTTNEPESPTLIQMKGGAFKSAACDSAVDTPDMKAAQVRRLISVPDFYVSIYGIPKLWMTDVRQAGINRTPDIRTRAIIPDWCVMVTYTFVGPLINQKKLLNLIENGGMTRGVGDGRTEKGALDFGQYTIVNPDDPRIKAIMGTAGRQVQAQAMESPQFYDKETADLFTWFYEELEDRKKVGKAEENGKHAMPEELEEAILN